MVDDAVKAKRIVCYANDSPNFDPPKDPIIQRAVYFENERVLITWEKGCSRPVASIDDDALKHYNWLTTKASVDVEDVQVDPTVLESARTLYASQNLPDELTDLLR